MQATVRTICNSDTGTVEVAEPTVNNVISVYSGAHGCMCGCIGNHRYNPTFIKEAANRGYGIDGDEVSERSVKTIITKLKKAGARVDEGNEGQYVFAETATRIYVAYFVKPFVNPTK